MKKLYHVIIAFHNEVAFRDEEDYLKGINILAIICIRTGAMLGAFSIMSDHVHFTVYTNNLSDFVGRFRKAYAIYFNRKYHRLGTLGSYGFHSVEIDGPAHIEACNSYVIRNATHHGITHTPYGYSFNSSACYFCKQLGHSYLGNINFKKYGKGHFLPSNNRPPQSCLLNSSGMIRPECFIEIALTEKQFGSARAYNFCMTRFSGEEWEQAQMKDNNGRKAVTLYDIEGPYSTSIDQMLEYEHCLFNENRLKDIDVCTIIDTVYLKKFNVHSYTELTDRQKLSIFNSMSARRDCNRSQIARCLAIKVH